MNKASGTLDGIPFSFLRNGSEMAARIYEFNWADTPLGSIDTWPNSLVTTLGIILNSGQPMVLLWGDGLIQFYNDLFIPSLGVDSKHPKALGQRASECWSEAWETVGPMVESVKSTGQPVYFEDQMISLFRNGREEDAYWTVSCSVVHDENGSRAGVLAICLETTEKVNATKRLLETQSLVTQSENNLRNIILQAPVPMCILTGPDHIVEIANSRMFEFWQEEPQTMLHKPILESIPLAKEQGFGTLLDAVYQTGKPYSAYGVPVKRDRGNQTVTTYINFAYEALRRDSAVIGVMAVALDVTEQVVATTRIAESEQKFRSVVQEAVIAMAVLQGRDMVLQLANEAMLDIWGRDQSIMGKPLLEFMPELKDQAFPAILDEVYQTGRFYSATDALVKLVKKGVIVDVYMDFSYKALRNTDGNVYAILVMAQDVTARVMAGRALKRSQDELRTAIQIADLGTFYIDRATYATSYSPRITDWFGFEGEDNMTEIIDYVVPEERERVIKSISDAFEKGIPHDITFKVLNPRTSEERYIRSLGKLQYNDHDEVVGMVGTLQDISRDINARKRIEESERNLRSIIVQAPVAMCILLGPSHVIDVANDAMITLWGKRKEDVMGKPIFEALPDAREQGLEQPLSDAYSKGITFRADERPVILLRNGKVETVYQNFLYQPYRNASGEILGVLAISNDVTDQVLARLKIEEIVSERTKELAEANSNLKASNSQLEQFAYIASHDLQEPARKITTFAEMLLNNFNDKEVAKRYIDKIASASTRMLTLIRDVLTFSQMHKDKRLFEKIDLNNILAATKSDFELLIEQKKAIIKSDALPVVEGITVQLQQLFANLISNSLKFIPNDRTPLIELTNGKITPEDLTYFDQPIERNDYFKLIFKDNGIGFKQEHAEQIFEIFQRLHGKVDFEGTGIGLAICRRIAENHGGRIYAKSRPGEGAEFVVLLPVAH